MKYLPTVCAGRDGALFPLDACALFIGLVGADVFVELVGADVFVELVGADVFVELVGADVFVELVGEGGAAPYGECTSTITCR